MLTAGQPSANCTKQSQGEPAKTLRTTNSRGAISVTPLRRKYASSRHRERRAAWQILRGPALRGRHEDEQHARGEGQ